MADTRKTIILSGGGTGGHITPVIQVAEQLRDRYHLVWIGDDSSMTRSAVKELGIKHVVIPAAKWHRYPTLANLQTPVTVARGVARARAELRRIKPAAVFAKGGYASLPVVVAAQSLAIPVVIHESDAVMGWANRLASRFARKICVNFPLDAFKGIARAKLVETGLPIAPVFFSVKRQTKPGRPRLLVTGGSQGAHGINVAIQKSLPQLLEAWDVDHVVGQRDFEEFTKLNQPHYRVFGFVDQSLMAQMIADSDVVLCRASATTFAEVAAVGRPAIVVPLPQGANRHGFANAERWTAAQAARSVDQDQLNSDRLLGLLAEAQVLAASKDFETARNKFVHPDAAKKIAAAVESVV